MEKEIKEEKTFDYTVEQFADLQLLRYVVHGFEDLSLEQKELVYYLSQAALEGWKTNYIGEKKIKEQIYQ